MRRRYVVVRSIHNYVAKQLAARESSSYAEKAVQYSEAAAKAAKFSRSPVKGRRRCRMHGGLPTRVRINPRRPDAKKLSPKPGSGRDPVVTVRRKAHAKLLRIDPTLAACLPAFAASPPASPSTGTKATSLPTTPPPWPADGYAGTLQARELEKAERAFITELVTPIDLERLLARATSYAPISALSARDVAQALDAFVQTMRQYTDDQLATFAEAEQSCALPPPIHAASASHGCNEKLPTTSSACTPRSCCLSCGWRNASGRNASAPMR